MTKNHIPVFALVILSLLGACASPSPTPDYNKKTPFLFPTPMPYPTQVIPSPTVEPEPTKQPVSPEGIHFLTKFSEDKKDWQVIPGTITATELNAEVAQQEGGRIKRDEQKVINGFLRSTIKEDGRVFEVLLPAEVVEGHLKVMEIKSIKQFPILSVHAVLLEDYFEINFPEVFSKWKTAGAAEADLKYAAAIIVTWATKYGPLRISYKASGKYITETGKYPGQLDFMKICMFEQTKERPNRDYQSSPTWYPAPIVAAYITENGTITGGMRNDAFGWTPMADFAAAENQTLDEIGEIVHAEVIESAQTLAKLQSAFDRAFMPIHCAEPIIQ
jgi:hypothetical protein